MNPAAIEVGHFPGNGPSARTMRKRSWIGPARRRTTTIFMNPKHVLAVLTMSSVIARSAGVAGVETLVEAPGPIGALKGSIEVA